MPGQEDGRKAVTGEMIDVINAAFHSKDVNRIAKAIGAAAKAQNVSEVARRAGTLQDPASIAHSIAKDPPPA
jgi:DNA-binding phage protein